MSIILGIDPGTRITGYGLIIKKEQHLQVIDFGTVRPPPTLSLHDRYLALYEAMQNLVSKFQPAVVSIETQFMQKNAQSALKLGMARGVILLAASQKGIPIFEYAPSKAKSAVAGRGNASKRQVQKMVQLLLHLPSLPTPEDAADALALAICHANNQKVNTCTNI